MSSLLVEKGRGIVSNHLIYVLTESELPTMRSAASIELAMTCSIMIFLERAARTFIDDVSFEKHRNKTMDFLSRIGHQQSLQKKIVYFLDGTKLM